MKVLVSSPSRIHVTLIDLEGSLGRVDCGVGFAVDSPRTTVVAEPYEQLIVNGVRADDVKRAAEAIVKRYGFPGARISVLSAAPPHVGLGSKTQLFLSTGKAVLNAYGYDASAHEIAYTVGRGGTSGIGVAVFDHGGFILDGGHALGRDKPSFLPSRFSPAPPPPILARYALPEEWRIVIAVPNEGRRVEGGAELKVFEEHTPIPSSEVEKLCRVILVKLLPAVVEKDIASFGEAINMIQGLGFKKIEVELQAPVVKELMKAARKAGAAGAGVSSMGPAVYAVVESHRLARSIASELQSILDGRGAIWIAKPDNTGAVVKVLEK